MPSEQNDLQATLMAVRLAKREVLDALADVPAAFDAHMAAVFAEVGGLGAAAAAVQQQQLQQAARGESGSSGDSSSGGGGAPSALPPNLAVLLAAAAEDGGGGNGTARAERLRIFRRNLRAVRAQNERSGDTLAFGMTPFTHMTVSEFRAAYLAPDMPRLRKQEPIAKAEAAAATSAAVDGGGGARRLFQSGGNALQCSRQVGFPAAAAGASPLPAAFDWRDVGGRSYVTRVKNQGSCGSCAAFAVAVAYEAAVMRKYSDRGYTADRTDLSEQRFLACWPGDQCRGALPHWYADLAACKGVAFEADWPYANVDRDSCPATTPTRFASGAASWAYAPTNPAGYARAIVQNPLPFGLSAGGSNAFMNYKAGVFDCKHASAAQVDHAVTLVGWNDAVQMSNGQTWGVFVAKNRCVPGPPPPRGAALFCFAVPLLRLRPPPRARRPRSPLFPLSLSSNSLPRPFLPSNSLTLTATHAANSWSTNWGEAGFFRVRKDCTPTSTSKGPLSMYRAGYATAILMA